MSDEPGSNSRPAPPSYSASIGISNTILVRERRPATSDTESESHLPPPFSVTPGILAISPGSCLIHSPVAGARPLYELSGPLHDRHTSKICLMSSSSMRRMLDDQARSAKTVPDEDKLYDISFKTNTTSGDPGTIRRQQLHSPRHDDVVIRARHKDQFGVVCLRKREHHHIGLTGGHKRVCFDVVDLDEEDHPRTIYQALPAQNKSKVGTVEWRDGGGMLVAVDTPSAVTTRTGEEPRDNTEEWTLEIVLSLDERHLDLLVALWVARMLENAKEEALRVDQEAARRQKARTKQLEGEEAHGLLHHLRGAFHI